MQGANVPLGKVIPAGSGTLLNGITLQLEATLFSGDALVAGPESWVVIQLIGGNQLQLAPGSSMSVTANEDDLLVTLDRGLALTRSGNGQAVSVAARGLLIRPSEKAIYQVTLRDDAVEVLSQEGALEVQGGNRTVAVPSGKAMRFVLAANTAPGRTGVGANNINAEAVIILLLVAGGAITGGVIAAQNDKAPESPSGL